jgi:ubiquinone/menaquinone biosynthesis C-methylase UbiE
MRSNEPVSAETTLASRAFGLQAPHFDEIDRGNPVLQSWRKQIYAHVQSFLRPGAQVLELNSGTGIDALYFSSLGFRVHATDAAEGMIDIINDKILRFHASGITCQQVDFRNLTEVARNDFDYIFSNFGGLNCIPDLSVVSRQLMDKLKPGGYVTWVIMPPFSPWELVWLLKGKWREATRRWNKKGAIAHVEGSYFQTYYHSLSDIRKAFGKSFELVRSEGLGVFSPPPSATDFYEHYPRLSRFLQRIDRSVKDHYPFTRWGDHIVVTFHRI